MTTLSDLERQAAIKAHRHAIRNLQSETTMPTTNPPTFYTDKAAKAKIATLEKRIESLEAENRTLKSKTATPPAKATVKPTAPTVAKRPATGTTAAEYGAKLTMTRAEFGKLSAADKSRFSKEGGILEN